MNRYENESSPIVPWKAYLSTTVETILGFCLSTFSLAMYLLHGGFNFLYTLMGMIFLYVCVISLSVKRMTEKFSVAAFMLIIPIAPLIVLILLISLIPLLQVLE